MRSDNALRLLAALPSSEKVARRICSWAESLKEEILGVPSEHRAARARALLDFLAALGLVRKVHEVGDYYWRTAAGSRALKDAVREARGKGGPRWHTTPTPSRS